MVLLSNPNPQKISTLGGDVPTLPGKPTDLVLRPRREDGTQISSHEARFLFEVTGGKEGVIRIFCPPVQFH